MFFSEYANSGRGSSLRSYLTSVKRANKQLIKLEACAQICLPILPGVTGCLKKLNKIV